MLSSTVFNIYRRSVTIKETLRIIQVYDFSCPTFLVKLSQTMELVPEIERYPCPRNSFVSSSLLQRKRSKCEKCLSETVFLELRSVKDQKHPQSGWLLMMKRGMPRMYVCVFRHLNKSVAGAGRPPSLLA